MLATLRVAHDFVVLTNKKAQTAFSPFGLAVLATLRVAHRFLTLTNTKTRTVFAPFGFTVLVIPGRITHNFLRLTNEETSFFTVHRRRCGASGNRRCCAPARVFGAQPPKTTGAGERSTRVRYLPAPALTGSNPSAYKMLKPQDKPEASTF